MEENPHCLSSLHGAGDEWMATHRPWPMAASFIYCLFIYFGPGSGLNFGKEWWRFRVGYFIQEPRFLASLEKPKGWQLDLCSHGTTAGRNGTAAPLTPHQLVGRWSQSRRSPLTGALLSDSWPCIFHLSV